MNKLSNFAVALIAGAASIFTSAILGIARAVLVEDFPVLTALFIAVGKAFGDLPIAFTCFGIVYGWLFFRTRPDVSAPKLRPESRE